MRKVVIITKQTAHYKNGILGCFVGVLGCFFKNFVFEKKRSKKANNQNNQNNFCQKG